MIDLPVVYPDARESESSEFVHYVPVLTFQYSRYLDRPVLKGYTGDLFSSINAPSTINVTVIRCCAVRTVIRSIFMAIKSIKHKGLELFHRNNKAAKIQPGHKKRLKEQLTALEAASIAEDMNLPGYDFHPLTGNKKINKKCIRYR